MIRVATETEHKFYREKLYPLQDEILKLIPSEKFYLTGGTCLSRFYYNHRYSDDLDFFFDGKNYPLEVFEQEFRNIANSIKYPFKLTIDSEYFKRIIIEGNEVSLKTEYIYEPVTHIGSFKKIENFSIDMKENIAANKITTLYGRKTYKDYFDLYYLLNEISLENAIIGAGEKMAPLCYEDALLAIKDGHLQERVLTVNDENIEKILQFISDLQIKLLNHAKNL